jgi:hypothetical protein
VGTGVPVRQPARINTANRGNTRAIACFMGRQTTPAREIRP